MERREFIKRTGMGVASLSLLGGASCASVKDLPQSTHHIPADKDLDPQWIEALFARGTRRPYRGEELETIGMPCGGIGAGQLYVRGDGTLAHWWIANNAHNTGPGFYRWLATPAGTYEQNYHTFRPFSPIEQGAALRVEPAGGGGAAQMRELSREGFDEIRFFGEYPVATIEYDAEEDSAWPVEVQAEVFSPFIPLNTRDSALPATVLRYTIKNTSNQPVKATLAGWMGNPVFLGHAGRVAAQNHNSVVREGGMTGVRMRAVEASSDQLAERRVEVFEDFESDTFEGWRAEGTAFGDGPVTKERAAEEMEGVVGNRFATSLYGEGNGKGRLVSDPFTVPMRYIVFEGEGHMIPEEIDVQLVVNGRVVRTAVGFSNGELTIRYWNVHPFVGEQARIQVIDRRSGNRRSLGIDQIYFTNRPPLSEEPFSPAHPQYGTAALVALGDAVASATAAWESKEGGLKDLMEQGRLSGPGEATHALEAKHCGAVAQTVRLAPGEEKTLSFLVVWHFPNRHQLNGSISWGEPASVKGPRVGNMYNNLFEDAPDVARYVADNYDRLTRETLRFRDTYFDTTLPYWFVQRVGMPLANLATEVCQWRENGRFWGWEGVGCCQGTCIHVWNYEQGMARLFPTLERSVREMQDLDREEGLYPDGAVAFRGRGASGELTHPVMDGQAGTVLKVYREHQMSPDDAFLRRNWPQTKQVLNWLIEQDANADGMISGEQANTYDVEFFGENTFVGALYLAALRAGEEMARWMGEAGYARRLHGIFEQGRRLTMQELWNGAYFIQDINWEKHPQHQYGEGCLSDQLFGQNWAHQVGLGYLYPEESVREALGAIWRYNWAPNVAAQNREHPPWRMFARPGERGLFTCTWPRSEHPGGHAVRYKNEVWTGIEHQVASHMIREGMLKEGLAVVRGVHERYDGVKHNPWNEVECGDHYVRALASWGALLGISGFEYDGPAGHIGFAPRLRPEDFRAFFSAAEGWGHLVQKRNGKKQTNRLDLKWGRLRARTLGFELPEDARLTETAVTVAGRAVPAEAVQEDRQLIFKLEAPAVFKLEAPAVVEANQTLEAQMRWA